jgi:hypothetical protein
MRRSVLEIVELTRKYHGLVNDYRNDVDVSKNIFKGDTKRNLQDLKDNAEEMLAAIIAIQKEM